MMMAVVAMAGFVLTWKTQAIFDFLGIYFILSSYVEGPGFMFPASNEPSY